MRGTGQFDAESVSVFKSALEKLSTFVVDLRRTHQLVSTEPDNLLGEAVFRGGFGVLH